MKPLIPTLLLSSPMWLAAQAQVASPAEAARSAYLAGNSQGSYVTSMKGRLAINQRIRDPFGLSQALDKSSGDDDIDSPLTPPDLFAPAIGKLRISAISPDEKTFMVDAREFREGQTFSMRSGGKLLEVQVEEVSPNAVRFRNSATGASVTRRFYEPLPLPGGQDDQLPPGVLRDTPGQAPPLDVP